MDSARSSGQAQTRQSPQTTQTTQTSQPRTRPIRRLGVEEEFHVVDLTTRRLAAKAPELLEALADRTEYVAELQQCVVEVNSAVVTDLDELRDELLRCREGLVQAATPLGLGIVAAGSLPLSAPDEIDVTETPRYRRMLADYQLLTREQLICGSQVHVDVADLDEACLVAEHVAPDLPPLLALSASSPYWSDGDDTGYASVRSLVWSRWPTTGLSSGARSAAEFDRLVANLVDTGVISDPGMIYFDVRPAARISTIELRICDSCPSTDTIVLVAGLFRAMVDRAVETIAAGVPPLDLAPVVGRAASWRAARSGLEGDLVDLRSGRTAPAPEIIRDLVASLEPWLRANGDWELVDGLTTAALLRGSSAARQRRARRRRGRLTDVVDQLIAETARGVAAPVDGTEDLLESYRPREGAAPAAYDEAVDETGTPRPPYADVVAAFQRLGTRGLRQRDYAIVDLQRADGLTFRLRDQPQPQVFPVDLIPRIVSASDWEHISAGGEQRARALDAFLRDCYGEGAIFADGVMPRELLDRAPGYRSSGRLGGPGVRNHVSGLDLVSDGPGRWRVLEDNLRVPSGVGYAIAARALMRRFVPEVFPRGIRPVRPVPELLRDTLSAAAQGGAAEPGEIAILSSGPTDSAWPEHTGLAEAMGVDVLTPSQVWFEDGRLMRQRAGRPAQVRVAYLRMDEDLLLSAGGRDGQPLRAGVIEALHRGTLTLANALGNGVGDDKAVYTFVPHMVRYYLGEEPILDQVPSWLCADADSREHVLDHLGELVTKPIDGHGGLGVLIGPDATSAQVAERRREILANPERYIGQELVDLSTHPTFDGNALRPRHVDLRVFVHLRRRSGTRETEAITMPAALSRSGAEGSKIVNSSAGGGSKDTWIMTDGEER